MPQGSLAVLDITQKLILNSNLAKLYSHNLIILLPEFWRDIPTAPGFILITDTVRPEQIKHIQTQF